MNNTNQQLYSIYENIKSFYTYRKLVSIDDEYTQDKFIKSIQKDKYVLLSAVDKELVTDNDVVDTTKLNNIKELVESHNEKSKTKNIIVTSILLVYPGTECESKKANMMKLINHIRFPNTNVIIITPSKVSSGISKGLQLLKTKKEHAGHSFKNFTYNLLSSILPEHILVPKYEILSADQINTLQSWFIDIDSLPKIFENDPQMVWIGANSGQVVKYIYLSEVTIESIGYCKVISPI